MAVEISYGEDIDEKDLGNTLGGENCTNSTVDGKAIVIR